MIIIQKILMDYFSNSFMATIIPSMKRVMGAERRAFIVPVDRGLAEASLFFSFHRCHLQ